MASVEILCLIMLNKGMFAVVWFLFSTQNVLCVCFVAYGLGFFWDSFMCMGTCVSLCLYVSCAFCFVFFFDISCGFVLSHSDLFDSIYFIVLLKIIISYKYVFFHGKTKGSGSRNKKWGEAWISSSGRNHIWNILCKKTFNKEKLNIIW